MSLEFGLWAPVCGSWLRVADGQHEGAPSQLAVLAEQADQLGYEFYYVPGHYLNAVHGPEYPVADAWAVGAAAVARTARVRVIVAVQPGFQVPGAIANMAATLARFRANAVGLSLLAGWWQLEVENLGDQWFPHGERYERTSELVDVLRAFWGQEAFEYRGKYFSAKATAQTGPVLVAPPIFIAGESRAAIELAARTGDYLFVNGGSAEQIAALGRTAKELARERYGRELRLALSAFGLVRASNAEAEAELAARVRAPDQSTIQYFAGQIDPAVIGHRRGSRADEVEANLALTTGLVGDPDRVIERLRAFERAGVDAVLVKFEPSLPEAAHFARLVIGPYRAHFHAPIREAV